MRLAKFTAATCLAAAVAGCVAQPGTDERVVTSAKPAPAEMDAAPPPAPPPPPSTVMMSKSGANMAQARIAAPGYYVPPVIIAQDPGREKYDGKEVSPVKLTTNEPVSTFSVDVDTGSYSNVRRMLRDGVRPPADSVRRSSRSTRKRLVSRVMTESVTRRYAASRVSVSASRA